MRITHTIYNQTIQLKKNNQKAWTDTIQTKHANGQQRMTGCETSLASREIQIRTTVSYHLTPVRITTINKTRDN